MNAGSMSIIKALNNYSAVRHGFLRLVEKYWLCI
jgi:hypothetical protein